MNEKMKESIISDLKGLEEKANEGNGFSCYILGRSYDIQENCAEQSFTKAMEWHTKGKEIKIIKALFRGCYESRVA